MRFAVAKEIISPPLKTYLAGYEAVYGQHFQGIHDDLYVRTLWIDDGQKKVVLLTLDLCFHDFTLTQTVGEYLRNKYDVSPDDLILSYTHTHYGPVTKRHAQGQESEDYERFLLSRIQTCLDRAWVNFFEGSIEYGRISGDWSLNRRKCIDGTYINAPNFDGITDRELVFLKVCDQEKNVKSLLINYSCHPVSLGASLWISADFPGRICHLLEAEYYGVVSLFFQGACGNVRPRIAADRINQEWQSCTFDQVNEMSSSIVGRVREEIANGRSEPTERLALASRGFVIPLKIEPYPKDYFERIVKETKDDRPLRKRSAVNILRQYDSVDDIVPLHASIVRLNNDLYIAFLCGEVCVEVKQHVKKVFGNRRVIFIGYGDSTAYIPDDKIIQEGGYEAEGSVVGFGLKGKFKLGIDKTIQDAYRENLELLS
jgi:hypothetical protein